MNILDSAQSDIYLGRYPVDRLFSFPARRYLTVCRIPKGEFLFRADAAANRLYFLVEGRAKAYVIHPNGKEALLSFIEPGAVMGDMELVGSRTESYLVEAMSDCVAVELALSSCRDTVLRDPVFLLNLCRLMGNKLYYKDTHLAALRTFSLRSKLAAFVLLTQALGRFDQPLTETAEYVGASYRHLQRTMAQFCQEGMLLREKGYYLLTDIKRLEAIASELNTAPKSKGFISLLDDEGQRKIARGL